MANIRTKGPISRKMLLNFIKERRSSGHNSNLQFQIDANACGFSVAALGPVRKFILDGQTGYQWEPDLVEGGKAKLVEFGAWIMLEGDDRDAAARHFFAHDIKRAEFVKAA